jgi:hypothetical protein
MGACLFALFYATNQDAARAPDEIIVSEEQVAALELQFERVWQRPPTQTELTGLIESWVRDEIMYREGLALGFDRDDPVIRRRVAQKIAFMSDALVDTAPSDEELRAWMELHPDKYRIEPVVSLRQVYFDPHRYTDNLESVLNNAREALLQKDDEAGDIGDASLLPRELQDAGYSELARTFGQVFAEAILELPLNDWAGPVRSGYGLHLVRKESMEPGRPASLDEVRNAVLRDLIAARKAEADEAFFQAMREQYEIIVAPDRIAAETGSR